MLASLPRTTAEQTITHNNNKDSSMRAPTCTIAAGLLAVAALSAARTASAAYGAAYDTVYRIDLAKPAASALGIAGRYAGQPIANLSGLTTQPDGSLLAIAGTLKALVRVDPDSGVATPIGTLGVNGGSGQFDALDLGMTSSCQGTLYLTSGVLHTLYTVNPSNGSATPVGDTGVAISGLAERGGVLYGAGAKGDATLYRIDPKTGTTKAIGSFGGEAATWINSVSLSFDASGTLWAVLNYVPPQNDSSPVPDWADLATIDPRTGKLHMVGPVTGPNSLRQFGMKGFTVGPTPCVAAATPAAAPVDSLWALLLLGAGMMAAAFRATRSKLS